MKGVSSMDMVYGMRGTIAFLLFGVISNMYAIVGMIKYGLKPVGFWGTKRLFYYCSIVSVVGGAPLMCLSFLLPVPNLLLCGIGMLLFFMSGAFMMYALDFIPEALSEPLLES